MDVFFACLKRVHSFLGSVERKDTGIILTDDLMVARFIFNMVQSSLS